MSWVLHALGIWAIKSSNLCISKELVWHLVEALFHYEYDFDMVENKQYNLFIKFVDHCTITLTFMTNKAVSL